MRSASMCGALIAVTAAVAAIGARPYAGSWNDGSRLATAESLVDRGEWAIDESIFVNPAATPTGAPLPYPANDALLMARGTLDRLFIDGRYVSDKTPVSNLFLAAEYKVLQLVTGLAARSSADRFCYWLTLFSSGLAFVAATAAMFVLARRMNLPPQWAAATAASFAFATCAAAYSRHINAHIVVLGAFALLMVAVDRLVLTPVGSSCAGPALTAGCLAGFVYGFDAVLGPLALVLLMGLCVRQRRSAMPWVVAAAAPWVAIVHVLNWRIGHTWVAPNSVAEYFAWPGSPFDAANLTGRYNHPTVGHAALYALDLVLGRHGFLLTNLPLLVAPLAAGRLVHSPLAGARRPAVWFAIALALGGWLVYAIGSTNHSGVALTVRWFVPLIAPLFYLVALDVSLWPIDRALFLALSTAGLGLGLSAWTTGPWEPRVPFFWWWLASGLIISLMVLARQRVKQT